MNSFYSEKELKQLGFQSYGKNVLISRFARFYGAENMVIGDSVRIDDFCILSGKITIGSYVHISAMSCLYAGSTGIVLEDYSGISPRCVLHAESDDFSGEYMTNSMVPQKFRNIIQKTIRIGKYAQIGSGSTLLPGAELKEGTVVGSMSLVKSALEPWTIYAGVPCKQIKRRSSGLLDMEKIIRAEGG